MTDDMPSGRIFFSNTGRSLTEEDQICVLSAGVDIGSSTSHLVFSRIVLERLDSRYVVTEREAFFESDILLTPYAAEEMIDAAELGRFIARQYAEAEVDPDEIDTGALILTGMTFNIASFVGAIMMVGILGENAIFVIHEARQELRQGRSVEDAWAGAARRRLRPVAMTILATAFALAPLALALGEGSQLQQPLAIAVIGGFVLSGPLVLLVLPALYSWLDPMGRLASST